MSRNTNVKAHDFAMVPQNNVPRSQFKSRMRHETTFDADYLVPFLAEEVYPGDTWNIKHTLFARMATPIYPVMDNLYLDTFYYFIPNRLLWTNWKRFMGEQDNPADSISYLIPQQVSPAGGYAPLSLQDYIGLPTTGMLGANTKSHSALFTRAYNFTWNQCFRDENMQNSVPFDTGDGPDATPNSRYVLLKRGKRFDYFTSALPWPQKGNTGVSIPLAGSAPVTGIGFTSTANGPAAGTVYETISTTSYAQAYLTNAAGTAVKQDPTSKRPVIFADLSVAGGVLINQLRQSIMIQEFLELDARGGTRYVEMLRMHFGVVSPDFRQQRPEYLGGGSKLINVTPISQLTATGTTGSSTPMGTQSGYLVGVDRNGMHYSATEHGILLGMIAVRADLTYQQGLARKFTRSTRYDFYDPAFAHLGNQAIRNDEIYCDGSANDVLTFGYKEAWDELRYFPSRTSGLFKSTTTGTIDGWHLAQKFASLPALNAAFIVSSTPMSRVLAVGAAANGQQFIGDFELDILVARAMPMFGIPHISGVRL